MARSQPSPTRLRTRLTTLTRRFPEDLCLPSLRGRPPRVQGHAYRFFLVVPLYSADGRPVYTDEHLRQLDLLFDARFGGCLVASSRSGAPFFGEYQPDGTEPVRDYHTIMIVYANPIEPSDRFFQELKAILKEREADFARCLTEKMLTYALGRGLLPSDHCAVERIAARLAASGHRFSTLAVAIVQSDPFRKHSSKGEGR